MRRIDQLMASAALLSAVLVSAPAAAESAGVKIGVLTCHVEAGWGFVLGSSKDVSCNYHPENGGRDVYVGSISKFGVDIGYSRGATIVWDVVAPTTDIGPGALEGDYAGATASASLFAGAGAHALFGGFDRSIALQPVSIEGNSGYDVAAGIGEMSLRTPPPREPRQAYAEPPPTPQQHAPKRFAVFFDFNRATLTPEAQNIVERVVNVAEQTGMVTIHVTGHTDTVGSDSYNQRLSVKRAMAVKTEMVRDGLSVASISIEGRGFHDPLVQTGPGIREPQNRRAIIDLGNPTVSANFRALTRHTRSI